MSEDFSCIKEIEKIISLPVPIEYINNEIAGIKEILDGWKKQYNNQLEGILVKYSNVSLISRANTIVKDKIKLLVNVKAKFFVFRPNVGDIVKGRIKRISKEHVGCIMHDTINAVIKLTEYCPDELKKFMRMSQDILYEITHFDRRRKEIFVVGKVTPHCLELMNDLIPLVPEENATSFSYLNQNVITRYDFDDIVEVSVKNDMIAAELVNLDTGSEEEINKTKKRKRDSSLSDDSEPKKKKKRKKDKSQHSDQSPIVPQDTITVNGDLSLIAVKQENNLDFNNGYELPSSDDSKSDGVDGEKHKLEKTKNKNKLTDKKSKHSKKKKKKKIKGEKKPKKQSSKKGKIVASGAILKADKKKSHKKKHSSKESNSNKKDKSKNKDKKKKKTKHKDNNLSDVKIKSED